VAAKLAASQEGLSSVSKYKHKEHLKHICKIQIGVGFWKVLYYLIDIMNSRKNEFYSKHDLKKSTKLLRYEQTTLY
jgi:hypothetical protein